LVCLIFWSKPASVGFFSHRRSARTLPGSCNQLSATTPLSPKTFGGVIFRSDAEGSHGCHGFLPIHWVIWIHMDSSDLGRLTRDKKKCEIRAAPVPRKFPSGFLPGTGFGAISLANQWGLYKDGGWLWMPILADGWSGRPFEKSRSLIFELKYCLP